VPGQCTAPACGEEPTPGAGAQRDQLAPPSRPHGGMDSPQYTLRQPCRQEPGGRPPPACAVIGDRRAMPAGLQ
jgi:hypothetical protein